MLLLFWNALDLLNAGPITSLSWYHTSDSPPRCLVTGEYGISVVNPYLNYEYKECSYALVDQECVDADIYQGSLVFGALSGGLFQIPWSYVQSQLCDVGNPKNMTTQVGEFTTFSGLLSETIIAIEANNDYIGIVTGSGLCYGKQGQTDFYTFSTESGKACYVCQDDMVYLAEGNRVLAKNSPADFSSWDREYNFGSEVNDVWVTEKDGIDTLFVATESGVQVVCGSSMETYGASNYSQVKAEVGTTFNKGHVFAVANNSVDIFNLQHKELEQSITYSGMVVVALENKRLYSK